MGADIRHAQYARLITPLLRRAGGYARSILRDRHLAEDAVQQAALRGLERFGTYDELRPFKGWWFAILRNCCIDTLRDRKSAVHVYADDHDIESDSTAPSDSLDWERLAARMSELSPDHYEILRLKYFADLSYREMAEALGIPQGTVMSRLHLARTALATKLGGAHP